MTIKGFKPNMSDFKQDGFEKISPSVLVRNNRFYSLVNGNLNMKMSNGKLRKVAVEAYIEK